MTKSIFLPALLATTCLVSTALASPQITRIELGQAGIARYTFIAPTEGNTLSFDVPMRDSDDVLASLVVRDPSGGVIDLQTDTPGSSLAALADTIFAGGVPRTTEGLVRAMIGETLEVTTARGAFTGRIMGVGETQIVEEGKDVTRTTVLMLTEDGVQDIVLTPGAQVTFSEDVAAQLARAMDADRRDSKTRRFDLTLEAADARDVHLSYVTEVAAWKNSWRLLLDEGRFQGWATVENVSGQDWDDVALTLTTGSPVAYRRELIDPLYIARNDPPSGPRPVTVAPDRGVRALAAPAAEAAYAPVVKEMLALDLAKPSGTARAGEVLSGAGILRYAMPQPVDLEDGRTANLMYFDMAIEPEIRALYRPQKTGNQVLMAASLQADQALAPGLVSVQDANGFVGDAPFTGMLAGQSRLLPFAEATGATVNTDRRQTQRISAMISGGEQVTVNLITLRTTRYDATVPEEATLFSVEHPGGFGELDSAPGKVEQGDGFIRVTVPVEAGEVSLDVVERSVSRRQYSLDSGDFERLVLDVRAGRIAVDAALSESFDSAHDLLRRARAIEQEITSLEDRQRELSSEQGRLRANLDAVEVETLRNRYIEALDSTETEIVAAADKLDELRGELRTVGTDLIALFDPK
ncbi:hypothetical protein PVW46_20525 [Mameliella sp. AT18]|uniref:hypothetical protein n=1 Tax=Mameliella sp. AT18 TaxID=3028385 RepID=UPI00084119BD|nr:hypothetical protein [Mameliella sp. AT18]MDD9732292.1 hypothetical protein [Mameliella sp. AT18]ODM49757.1 hypothetical protein A9320_13440 [Ruegeria sp. PBVC088]